MILMGIFFIPHLIRVKYKIKVVFMKMKVVCTNCEEEIDWIWGNQIARCEACNTILDIHDVKIAKNSYENFLPAA